MEHSCYKYGANNGCACAAREARPRITDINAYLGKAVKEGMVTSVAAKRATTERVEPVIQIVTIYKYSSESTGREMRGKHRWSGKHVWRLAHSRCSVLVYHPLSWRLSSGTSSLRVPKTAKVR